MSDIIFSLENKFSRFIPIDFLLSRDYIYRRENVCVCHLFVSDLGNLLCKNPMQKDAYWKREFLKSTLHDARRIATKATPSLRTCQRVVASQRNTVASRECASSSMSFVTLLSLLRRYASLPCVIKKGACARADSRSSEVRQLYLPSSNSVRTI